jgi:hypothetical protein
MKGDLTWRVDYQITDVEGGGLVLMYGLLFLILQK